MYPPPLVPTPALNHACLDCGRGFETRRQTGASQCYACDAGRFSEALSVNCTTCEPGTYSKTQAFECSECEEEHYTKEPGQSACLKCTTELGDAYTSVSGAAGCQCKTGFFLYGSECRPCPDGSSCPQGTMLADIEVTPGYYRFSLSSPKTYACPIPANCAGGVGVAGDDDDGGGDGNGDDEGDDKGHERRHRHRRLDRRLDVKLGNTTSSAARSCVEGAGGPLCYVW